MSDTKTVLEQIKDEYAREKGYEDWEDVLRYHEESLHVDEIAIRYATACCKASLEKGAENATEYPCENWNCAGGINKDSITDPDNIVLL